MMKTHFGAGGGDGGGGGDGDGGGGDGDGDGGGGSSSSHGSLFGQSSQLWLTHSGIPQQLPYVLNVS